MLNNSALWLFDSIASHIWQIDSAIIDTSRKLFYAIDIELDCSSSIEHSTIGLKNSHMRLITGRPDFDGTAGKAFYEDGSANDYQWFEGILLSDKLGTSSQSIDVSVMGDIGTFAGFDFSISDCEKQWRYINKETIQFINRKITHYVVIDNVFYSLWSGVVEDTEYNDTEVKFHCVNMFNSIHKPMPPRSAVQPEFPNTDEADSANTIPIIIGDVVNARLVLINKSIDYLDITGRTINNDVASFAEYHFPYPIVSWVEGMPYLITWDKYFAQDALAGKYFLVVNGGGNVKKNKMVLIRGNAESFLNILPGPTTYQKYLTPISVENLSDYEDIATNFTSSYSSRFTIAWAPYLSSWLSTRWFAKVVEFAADYSLSDRTLSGLLYNSEGLPIIRVWNEQSKSFSDISNMFRSINLTTGTVSMKPKIFDGENSASYNVFYKPEILSVRAGYINPNQLSLGIQYAPAPAIVQGDIESLTDKDRATYMSVFHPANYQAYCGAVIEISINDTLRKTFAQGNLTLCADLKFEVDTTKAYYVNLNVAAEDNYGTEIQSVNVSTDILVGRCLPGDDNLNMIDDEYYNDGNLNSEVCHNHLLFSTSDGYRFLYDMSLLDGEICSLITAKVLSKLRFVVSVRAQDNTAPALQLDIKQIAFSQTAAVSIDSDTIFASVRGEMYGAYETNNVYRALQHILIDYDKIDAGDIDFGNLSSKRKAWNVGRQLTERKSSLDYISELCRQSFIAYWQKRDGTLGFSAWRENEEIEAFHNENVILRDTIRGIQRSRVSNLYNEFSIQYAWSDVLKRYEKEFFITKIDESDFPLSTDSTWKTFVGGLSDASYADAKALWNQCHAAYLKSKTIQKLSVECPWFIDLSQLSGYSGGGIGTSSSAFMFLKNLVEWATWQKDIVQYDLPLTVDTTKLDLMQYVSFEDLHLTNSTALGGWIVGLSCKAKNNLRTISVLLKPVVDEAEQDNLIIETGDSALIIETGTNVDTITEGA